MATFYPSRKLIVSTALVLLLSSLLYAFLRDWGVGFLLLAAVCLIWVVWDGLGSMHLLEGVKLKDPSKIRLSRNRSGRLTFTLCFPTPVATSFRVGVLFPDLLACDQPEFLLTTSESQSNYQAELRFRAVRRGGAAIQTVSVESASKAGFWRIQNRIRVDWPVQVFPDLISEKRQLTGLLVRQGMLGIHSVRQLGKGKDFEKLREYVPGDDYQDIHWKASAKRNRPVTKIFQLERTQDIYVVIDASRLSGRPCPNTTGQNSQESYLEKNLAIALLFAQVAEQQGDRFGFITYSDRVNEFLRASTGRAHFNACRDTLNRVESTTSTPDFREVFTSIRSRLNRRSLMVFLVSLDDALLKETFLENVDLIRSRHIMLVAGLRSRHWQPLFSNRNITSKDEIIEELAGHEQWESWALLKRQLRSRGVDLILAESDRLGFETVNQYMSIKKRQIL